VPAASPAIEALTCKIWGALPLVGVAVSQGASLAAVKLSVPLPVLLTLSDTGAGSAPPTVPLKLTVAGATLSTGPLAAEP
jgi:hypothetical protein